MERPTRVEQLKFVLTLDRQKIEANADDVRTLHGGSVPILTNSDDLTLTYTVFCEYFGDVARRLAALNRLLDVPGLPVLIDVEELNHGHSLIVGVARQIEALQKKLT